MAERRMALMSYRPALRVKNLNDMGMYIDKITDKFYSRSDQHTNDLIHNLGKYSRDSLKFRLIKLNSTFSEYLLA